MDGPTPRPVPRRSWRRGDHGGVAHQGADDQGQGHQPEGHGPRSHPRPRPDRSLRRAWGSGSSGFHSPPCRLGPVMQYQLHNHRAGDARRLASLSSAGNVTEEAGEVTIDPPLAMGGQRGLVRHTARQSARPIAGRPRATKLTFARPSLDRAGPSLPSGQEAHSGLFATSSDERDRPTPDAMPERSPDAVPERNRR